MSSFIEPNHVFLHFKANHDFFGIHLSIMDNISADSKAHLLYFIKPAEFLIYTQSAKLKLDHTL